jgi:AraC family transcriptional regulator
MHHEEGRHFVIEVEPRLLDSITGGHSIFSEPRSTVDGSSRELAAQLYREFRDGDQFSSMAMEGIALELLANSARAERRRNVRDGKRQLRLDRVLELLHQSFPALPPLGTLAKAVEIHPVYLATIFRKAHGCTIGEYVRSVRIKYACSRMVSSNDPLVQIALESGFADQTHFSRSFRRVTGMAPAFYRRTFRVN